MHQFRSIGQVHGFNGSSNTIRKASSTSSQNACNHSSSKHVICRPFFPGFCTSLKAGTHKFSSLMLPTVMGSKVKGKPPPAPPCQSFPLLPLTVPRMPTGSSSPPMVPASKQPTIKQSAHGQLLCLPNLVGNFSFAVVLADPCSSVPDRQAFVALPLVTRKTLNTQLSSTACALPLGTLATAQPKSLFLPMPSSQ